MLRISFKHRYFWRIVPTCYGRNLTSPVLIRSASGHHLSLNQKSIESSVWLSCIFLIVGFTFFFNPLWVTVGTWFNIFYSPSSWKFMWIRMAHGSSITATAPSLRSPCFQSSSQARYYQRITCCFWTNSVSVSEQRVLFQIFSLSLQIPAWSPSISISL